MVCESKNENEMTLLTNEYSPWLSDESDRFTTFFSQISEEERQLYTKANTYHLPNYIKQTYKYTIQEDDRAYLKAIQHDIVDTGKSHCMQNIIAWVPFMSNVANFVRTILVKTHHPTESLDMYSQSDRIKFILMSLIIKSELDNIIKADMFHQLYTLYSRLFSLCFGLNIDAHNNFVSVSCYGIKKQINVSIADYYKTQHLLSDIEHL
jgi:hypothetical protein